MPGDDTAGSTPLHQQVYRYLLMTGLSAVVTVGLPALLHEVFGVGEERAVAVSLAVAFCVNFLTARFYIFRSGGHIGGQLVRFALVSAAFRIGEYLAFLVLHTWLGLMYLVALAAILFVSIVLKFFSYRHFVF